MVIGSAFRTAAERRTSNPELCTRTLNKNSERGTWTMELFRAHIQSSRVYGSANTDNEL